MYQEKPEGVGVGRLLSSPPGLGLARGSRLQPLLPSRSWEDKVQP